MTATENLRIEQSRAHLRTQIAQPKLVALAATLDAVAGVAGDLAELGVYRGGVARLLATSCPARTVHLFDTFTGIPWDGYDVGLDRHQPGEFSTRLNDVCEYLADCPNVSFHPGLFPGTATGDRFAFVHLDADLYASTWAGLAYFWPRLSPGGAVVLDDWRWPWCPGVAKAVADYFGAKPPTLSETAPYQLTIIR
jgi:O-methyltransferase